MKQTLQRNLTGRLTHGAGGLQELENSGKQSLIEVRDLYKYYQTPAGDLPALRGVNLHVKRGEFLAVVGKSGAGKSTLVNMLTCIDRPSSGDIFFNNQPVHVLSEDQKARWRGKNLGVVFQFFQLLPSLNLIENITLAMDFNNAYSLRERHERALHLLEQVGIAEHACKVPAKISGGQQQRVAIARALANDPPLIIADEPTGNLDSSTAGEIFDLFTSLVDQGKTLLVVTHDKEIAARASRRIEISDGQIVN
jgi:ABC-type lipoprotein export system ATPase subunit